MVAWAILCAATAAALAWFHASYMSPTRVAFVNEQPVAMQEYAQANHNKRIKLYAVDTAHLPRLRRCDVVLVNGMGLQLTEPQRAYLKKLAAKGKPFHTTMATNPDNDISNLPPSERQLVVRYQAGGGRRNLRSLLNFLRRNVDGKLTSIGPIDPPADSPSDYLYFPAEREDGEESVFFSVSELEAHLRQARRWRQEAPRVVVTGLIADLRPLILALSDSGLNVYPISTLWQLPRFLEEIRPDAVINAAHGRLGDDVVQSLRQHNTLLFDPLYVNATIADWEQSPMGMSGGFLSQSVALPELDGAIRTSALFALKQDKNGLLTPCAIPGRLEEYVQTVQHHLALRAMPNAQKRLAIVYYKGPGHGDLVASGMDVTTSLYRLLTRLRAEGYRVDGLPASEEAFAQQLQQEGSLFNACAAGDAERYLRDGHPQLVTKAEYETWQKATLPTPLAQEVEARFGPFPGTHNLLRTPDGRLAFPRIRYGNIVLVPQPLAGEGKDEFRIVHGTQQAPPHSYIAPYLWIQKGFRAHALLHFGTHGSLEFTPSKQIALSSRDWPDRLVGTLPHFYLYTIDNVGEAMTARRRSYGILQSHLTPPFHESQLRQRFGQLDKLMQQYEEAKGNRQGLAKRIKQQAIGLGLAADLGLDSNLNVAYGEDDMQRLANYKEELAAEKVTDRPYTLGVAYREDDVRSSVHAMTVDPLAYSLYALDRMRGQAPADLLQHKTRFTQRYLLRAQSLAAARYGQRQPVSTQQLAALVGMPPQQIDSLRALLRRAEAPKGMAAMMRARAADTSARKAAPAKAQESVPPARRSPLAKMMRRKARKAMATHGAHGMLEMARQMGASEEAVRKMAAAMGASKEKPAAAQPARRERPRPATQPPAQANAMEMARALREVETALNNVAHYRKTLLESPSLELASLLNALSGGYTAPSPGGDPIANPNTLPTGRNLFSINAEETPTEQAWQKGKDLAEQSIEAYRKAHGGDYPRKVAFTLWSSEFILTGGATVAQALYMLGVEPVRDRFGRVSDIRLIPSATLGRPRIDIVVQTSGQLRDLAASRLFLLHRAVAMAAEAHDEPYENGVRQGVQASERALIDKGIPPKEARAISRYRVFGGLNGGYGTGIQGMVEQGNAWDDNKEIAEVYLNNMGAFYGDPAQWEAFAKEAFAAALTNTDVVMHPRQSNTWGALSLDHVYEFMGGMNLAVQQVTGKDPDAYFADYRNRNDYHVQSSHDAIVTEARTKLLNQAFIARSVEGGASSADMLAEMVRNLYGWNVTKPSVVSDGMWDEVFDVYVADKLGTDLPRQLEAASPMALQQITATMLETARKGLWDATPEQVGSLARLHAALVERHGPSGDSFDGANPKLQEYVAQHVPQAAARHYRQQMEQQAASPSQAKGKAQVLHKQTSRDAEPSHALNITLAATAVVLLFVALAVAMRIRRSKRHTS